MRQYRFSALAEIDLANILDYTTDIWGGRQAELYLDSLAECFARITKFPQLGRSANSVHSGVRRIEQGSHVIFYQPGKDGIFINRILHQSMLPSRHELLDIGP